MFNRLKCEHPTESALIELLNQVVGSDSVLNPDVNKI